jgi:hypothetical protein
MNLTDKNSLLTRRIRLFAWILAACWTLLIGASWYWNVQAKQKMFHKIALAEARAVIKRDELYRRWASAHGGVYAPTTPQSPPNRYLSHVPERDIRTPSGKQLTLINPAYMTRQVNELSKEDSVFIGRAHITSLKPLRPENAPDPWEASALRAFDDGSHEVSAVVMTDGKPYLRLILLCHIRDSFNLLFCLV